jgi:transaldolase
MKFFVDSSDPKEIRTCVEQGLIEGASVSVSSGGRDVEALVAEVCDLIKGPVSVEVAGEDKDGLVRGARALAKIAPNVVVRVPLTAEGLKAVRICTQEKIPTHVTLCTSPVQALLAAKAGARWISPSPSPGRADETAADGIELVRKTVAIYKTYGFDAQVLVASIRGANHIVEAALVGAQAASVPFAVLQALVRHPASDAGLGT